VSGTRLRALPQEVIATLQHAADTGDIEAAGEAVELVRVHDEALARGLERVVRAYRFDVIQDALGEVPL
jgi:hypothetical protein